MHSHEDRPARDGPPSVEVTLIDAMLALTPEQRLRQNDRMLQTIRHVHDGFFARQSDDPAHEPGGERR